MKIINEKGKLFGLINIVDLLVLIAAVAVAAGVGYKLFAPQIKESVQPQVELTAIVRVRGATPFLRSASSSSAATPMSTAPSRT